jgi:transmembrane sensor
MDYTFYKAEDFVTDESFIQWVKHPTPENDAFWRSWLSKHPEQESVISQARQIVVMLDFREIKAPEGKFLVLWEKINDQDNQRPMVVEETVRVEPLRISRWYRLAAACILIAAALVYFIPDWRSTVTIQTQFGESRSVLLPDSTKVTLNSNSSLRYAADFQSNRQVWLNGEAFFVVTHKSNDQNFRVHTNDVEVEVLGTKFNVNTRRGKSRIVLEEGKVKLALPSNATSPVMMKPGEMVEVSKENTRMERRTVDTGNYSSWRINKLTFVSTSLEEIAQLLEDNYGYTVTFGNDDLKKLEFTGSADVDDPGELLQKLARVFELTIVQDGHQLKIQPRE